MALPRELHAIIEQTHNLNTHINAFTSIVSLQRQFPPAFAELLVAEPC